ncbi:signal transduction histidine kinase regulating citrate/malate metabolism [Proteiniborus sp. DW1]|uniref:sensor histidine kinase n=1 Tax=Proteiniborus sp. DW1 TaxID=1889883 RepID=UPI00092E0ABF|nr:ATP-binding protein [Proteiniborus sp. DW1]SCG83638.1 signal transduction histidine kinase regulating citrate/malate metabolism [Proteiniborus sp. DW1]
MNKNFNIYANKAIRIIVVINLIQVILVTGLITVYLLRDNLSFLPINSFDLLLISLVSISLINNFLVLKDIRVVRDLSLQNNMKSISLQNISELNNVLRAQRHDFLNHLQVVYSLIELNEYTEASNYIETVYKDIIKVNRSLKTSNAAINALLQAKLVDCENKDILVELHIDTRLENLIVPDWEMCRVLGNLIDNAIDAVKESKEKGFINIEIVEIDSNYVFTIRNSGKSIPKEMLDSIFEPGYTTKRNRGEGMGLAITKKITQKYNGKITVDSNQSVTTFSVYIPSE